LTQDDDNGEGRGRWSEIFLGRYGVYTLVLNLGMTLFAINQFVVATLMPTIVAELGGVDFYTWAFSLFAVGAIIGSASAGPLREAFGAQLSYAGAGLVLGAGIVAAALANDMPTFVASRLIQGIGGGAVASHAYGLVAMVYPQRLRSRALSIISTIWGTSTVIGPGFGGAFAEPGLWRNAFWVLVPFTIAFAALAWRYTEKSLGHGRLSELPYGRLALLGLAIVLVSGASLAVPNWSRGVLIAAAIAITALAFVLDARAPRNMFPRQAMAIGCELGATYWILFLISIVMAFVNTYTTFYLQVLHGIGAFTAGYLFAIQSFTWTFGALIAATARSALEMAFIVIGLAFVLVASVVIALVVDRGPVVLIAFAIGVAGIGIGLMNNPAIQRIMAAAPEPERHVAGTSVQSIRNIGVSFGAATAGMVAAIAGLADGADHNAVAAAMRWVYGANVAFAILPLALAVLLFVSGRPRRAAA
jgi:MFS family permease